MNWKQFRKIFKKEAYNESSFILGLDVGNDSSAIASFDVRAGRPEIIDLSGGYGKPSMPTVVQYIANTREWIFGEYALLNGGAEGEVTLSALVDRLGKREYADMGDRSVSVANVLSRYIKEITGSVRSMDPNATIAGMVVSVPSYMGSEAREELLLAFKAAGLEKELIELAPDRECVFARYYSENSPQRERIMMLDFGGRELRGGVYDVRPEGKDVHMSCAASLFNRELGTDAVNGAVKELFTAIYRKGAGQHHEGHHSERLSPHAVGQLEAFAWQHRDLMFQKPGVSRPVRLYFNFAYPPFAHNVTGAETEEFIAPFRRAFRRFIGETLEKSARAGQGRITPGGIDRAICVGGGFEMAWARDCVRELFPDSNIVYYKNAKAAACEGAAALAAGKLGAADMPRINIEDLNQLTGDIGVKVTQDRKERFMPIVERNAFWWQEHAPKLLLVCEKTDEPVTIEICTRDERGDTRRLRDITLDGLPNRPRGTTRIRLNMSFESCDMLTVKAEDCGFGELFPATDYAREYSFKV